MTVLSGPTSAQIAALTTKVVRSNLGWLLRPKMRSQKAATGFTPVTLPRPTSGDTAVTKTLAAIIENMSTPNTP
jgi:hypothetical protein